MLSVDGHNAVWTGFKNHITPRYLTAIREGPG
jgi:hypothetical protein